MKYNIGDILIWQRGDDYEIIKITNVCIDFYNYKFMTVKTNNNIGMTNGTLSQDWIENNCRLITPLEKLKYL